MPPYVIFQDAVLLEMVKQRPRNRSDLRGLSGVGETKLQRYGARFLAVIQEHPGPAGEGEVISDTALTSRDLFRLGMSTDQIAAHRGLKSSTIFTHLALAILHGQLTAREVVNLPIEEVNHIEKVWNGLPDEEKKGVKPLFEAFEGRYEYGVLRCLLAEWQKR